MSALTSLTKHSTWQSKGNILSSVNKKRRPSTLMSKSIVTLINSSEFEREIVVYINLVSVP